MRKSTWQQTLSVIGRVNDQRPVEIDRREQVSEKLVDRPSNRILVLNKCARSSVTVIADEGRDSVGWGRRNRVIIGRIFIGVRIVHTELIDIDERRPLFLESMDKLFNDRLIAEIADGFIDSNIRIDQNSLSQRNPVAERVAQSVDMYGLISGLVRKLPEGRPVQSLTPTVWQIGLPHTKAKYRPRNKRTVTARTRHAEIDQMAGDFKEGRCVAGGVIQCEVITAHTLIHYHNTLVEDRIDPALDLHVMVDHHIARIIQSTRQDRRGIRKGTKGDREVLRASLCI